MNDFDVIALYEAMAAQRIDRGLSWRQVAGQIWDQSRALNERRADHPISPSTLTGIARRGDCTCQHALFILRWLGRAPESFLLVPAAGAALPAAGPDRRPRWNLAALYDALDARRNERRLTWVELARQLRCTANQLTGIRTARYAIGMRLAMRIVQWLERPASDVHLRCGVVTSEGVAMSRRPAMVAALVNGLVVQLTPSGLAGIVAIGGSLGFGARSNRTTVHPPGWTPLIPIVATTFQFGLVLLPFALLAAWRTWVHAKRRLEFGTSGWQGVVEAAALGMVTWFVMALPSILANPTPAFLQLLALSALASFLGLLVELVLFATALIALALTKPATTSRQ